ncbi:oxidoreductase [Oleiphilus sp. HI0071]|nr:MULTISPECIES: NAD(P)-dependent oxidoreductase [unclassified Oleiphilus]KZY62591.1 oxidoreductase [Oleiphilus sp. HI0065]KZY80053.1 oxidoreductase [Oleiphilus sp. HI0071]KZY96683.1 oxidoreductase [Oleiphilus sp. HI0073]KZZ40898.1 oxidoreductase [Oleiphilus sp. HI0118]KZZ50807.1 oxidoreductase [Oleiphilus sp. HI0122]KZZ73772.1 oxidoreductase [Oleiphilus sp. HI0130]KZZ74207.1 oxidoreductase [Oleiphilus sp. HI0133]
MPSKVVFIGLGVMGYHMAGHLSKEHEVYVYNRSPEKRTRWLSEFSGTGIENWTEIPHDVDCVMTCIGDDNDLRSMFLGESALLTSLPEGTLVVDHTTASADVARELYAEAKQHGISFVDGPVSGGEQGAINGQLTVMCGGDQDAYSKAETFINAFAKSCKRMGNTGSGQLTKMCNQIAIAGLVQGLAESIHFAQQAGLDPHNVIEVISKGAAQSWQMENRHKTMIANEYEHGFAVDWMRKDLGICLEEARRVAAKLPVTALVDQFYGDVQDMDGGRWDTSSLLTRLQKK